MVYNQYTHTRAYNYIVAKLGLELDQTDFSHLALCNTTQKKWYKEELGVFSQRMKIILCIFIFVTFRDYFCCCHYYFVIRIGSLAGVAQWIECWPENQKAAGLIPSQGTCLGWGPVPSWGHVRHK